MRRILRYVTCIESTRSMCACVSCESGQLGEIDCPFADFGRYPLVGVPHDLVRFIRENCSDKHGIYSYTQ